ncbi:hypothetical protein A9239_04100 [Methanosarcina sp. A14]|nr:hypothetical protein A9239_04100 [Methanosarcina sp. A14]
MKGMSIEAIADVLEVESASVKRWLARVAEQCDKVNDSMMKDLNVPKIEMDEQNVCEFLEKDSGRKQNQENRTTLGLLNSLRMMNF